ncbi:MAG: Mth938-like domain-containing protein [Lautropia sp.]
MKLHDDRNESLNTITAYGEGWFEVNAVRHQGPILVMPEGEVEAWPLAADGAPAEGDLDPIIARAPEVVLLGTGIAHAFAPARLTARLHAAGIGVESMDSRAACRTYNILMVEGRRVLAALLPY